jgi:hypothetical protein
MQTLLATVQFTGFQIAANISRIIKVWLKNADSGSGGEEIPYAL